jgi:hypothetical protein
VDFMWTVRHPIGHMDCIADSRHVDSSPSSPGDELENVSRRRSDFGYTMLNCQMHTLKQQRTELCEYLC